MVITTTSLTATQGPAGSLVVSVRVTVPLLRSRFPGSYSALRRFSLLNVPSPELDQTADVAEPPITPDSVTLSPEQMVTGAPASTVAKGLMVKTTLSDTDGHAPAGSLVVSVSVTVPAAISPALGV